MREQRNRFPFLKDVIPGSRYSEPTGVPNFTNDFVEKPVVHLAAPLRSFSAPAAAATLPQILAMTMPTITPSGTVKISQKENLDGPEHKFQINEQLLFEHDFHGNCYVSAHLQRLQHGIFRDPMVHGSDVVHVTFMAITFIFHPSVSLSHRFKSAVIEVTARSSNNEPLRFIKFAPHLAFGRISTETLKWTFQLGATMGVTKGPVNLAVTPSMSQQKDKVLGTMMKIQGSTRSKYHKMTRIPDTRLFWSIEENDQQQTGLPREFTFVFLVERQEKTQFVKKEKNKTEQDGDVKAEPEPHRGKNCINHAATYAPMHIGIKVKPHISNFLDGLLAGEYDEALVVQEVGQRLLVEHSQDVVSSDVHAASGYYNFAKMPGNFEDLIELPGNAVTSVVYQTNDEDVWKISKLTNDRNLLLPRLKKRSHQERSMYVCMIVRESSNRKGI